MTSQSPKMPRKQSKYQQSVKLIVNHLIKANEKLWQKLRGDSAKQQKLLPKYWYTEKTARKFEIVWKVVGKCCEKWANIKLFWMAQKVEKFSLVIFLVFFEFFCIYLYLLYLCLKEHFYLFLFVILWLLGIESCVAVIMILRKPASLGWLSTFWIYFMVIYGLITDFYMLKKYPEYASNANARR